MSTPQENLGALGGLFDPPRPGRITPRPTRTREPARRAAPPREPAPAPSNPYKAYDAQTEGSWSISEADALKGWFRDTYGRELPVSAAGQSSTHTGMGFDHSDSLDVGINPTSEEGKALRAYLRARGAPFLAYDRPVPGAATNAHIHVGFPSHKGAAGEAARLGSINYLFDPVSTEALKQVEGLFDDSGEYGEPERINAAPRVDAGPAPLKRTPLDVKTMEGRRVRDESAALAQRPGSYVEVATTIPPGAPNWQTVPGSDVVREAVLSWARQNDIDVQLAHDWIERNAPNGYTLYRSNGTPAATVADVLSDDSFDPKTNTLRVKVSAQHLAQLRDHAVLSPLFDPLVSPGELALDVAGPPAQFALEKGARAADLATRPLQSIDAAFWAKLHGADNIGAVKTAYQQFFGERPELGRNVLAEMLRHSDRLAAVNPRLPTLLGELANIVLEPSNVIPLGAAAKGAKALRGAEEASRLGRALEAVGGAAREAGVFERGMSEARPLGALDDAGMSPALRELRGEFVQHLDDLEGEIGRAHETGDAEAFASAQAARSHYKGLVEQIDAHAEAVTHARERAAFYEREAAAATDPARRSNAQALADDYHADAARLEGSVEPPPVAEGYDLTAPRERVQPVHPSSPPRSLPRRALHTALDVAGVPKAVMASADLSAPGRQGIVFLMTEPKASASAARDMLRSLSKGGHTEVVAEMAGHPKFDLAKDSGLYLANFGAGEEVFGGTIARRIPGVKVSDRTFETFLDSQRLRVFSGYADELIAAGITPESNPEEFKALASWVNKATGRGDLGRLDGLSRVGNALMFSPRLTASRFQILNPVMYATMPPAARKIALRKMLQFTGTLGGLLGTAYLAGADASLDPRSSDFGKISFGKTHLDASGGNAYTLRFLTRFAKASYLAVTGAKPKQGDTPLELAAHYLRTRLSPAASLAVDRATGTTVEGEPFTWKSAAFERLVPLFVQDLTEAMEEEGWVGAVHAAPSGLGFGVNTYDAPKREKYGHDRRTSQAAPAEPPAHEEIRRAVEAADPDAEVTFREFPEGMSELRVPRASMPQVKGEHRGAMVQFLKGRGIAHIRETVPVGSLKASQAEWSPEKVARARAYDGPKRPLLVSSDGHVADGHHQYLSKLYDGPDTSVDVIRLDSPILPLLMEMARFPSSGVDDASAAAARPGDGRTLTRSDLQAKAREHGP